MDNVRKKFNPVFMRKFALGRMTFWAVLMPVTAFFHHFKLDVQLAIMEVSLYANFATDLTNYTASAVEVKQDEASGNIEVEASHADVHVNGKGSVR